MRKNMNGSPKTDLTLPIIFRRHIASYWLLLIFLAVGINPYLLPPALSPKQMAIDAVAALIWFCIFELLVKFFANPIKIIIDHNSATIISMGFWRWLFHKDIVRDISEFSSVALKHVYDPGAGATLYIADRLVLQVKNPPKIPWYRYDYAERYQDGDIILIECGGIFSLFFRRLSKKSVAMGKQLARLLGLPFYDGRRS